MVRLVSACGVAATLLLAASAAATPAAPASRPSAQAFAIRVIVPGGAGAWGAAASAPKDTVAVGGAFAYPSDGSGVSSGSITAGAFTVEGSSPSASASSEVTGLSLFGGELTASTVSARAKATAGPNGASGDVSGGRVDGLTALGQAVPVGPGARVSLGEWGYVIVLAGTSSPTGRPGLQGYRAATTALQVHLLTEHAGLPAGTQILVGYAEAFAEASLELEEDARRRPKPVSGDSHHEAESAQAAGNTNAAKRRKPRLQVPPLTFQALPEVVPKLTAKGYVFPVYGPSAFSNDFAAARAQVGWHHGNDIYAPLGAPILAVADGYVFSVGWNRLGGLRFWLKDRQGNEFYYAHLSAFSPLAVDGRAVKAGDVIGFVGNTGDAEGTPYHLHFEFHPVSLLAEGYDGVANPYTYLLAWKRLKDVPISRVAGWAAAVAASSRAPKPAAILLQASDISSASGLDPGSLEEALRQTGRSADGTVGLVKRRLADLVR